MINSFQLIRNVGTFDSVATAANIPLSRLSLIYAENGRGKTTLTAILRSLATGDPILINERRRLSAQHPPHIVIECVGGPPAAMFQAGSWNRTLANIAIFDDLFVDLNVYSGLAVGVDQRQNLHELILGAQGVSLNQHLQSLIARVEVHNRELRQREAAIPISELGGLTVDNFCALPVNQNVASEIEATQRNLAASLEQEPVRNTSEFAFLVFPSIDFQPIFELLQAGVDELDSAAATRVQEHLATCGADAEEWIADGMRRQAQRPAETINECVFCAQNLSGSPVISHYRAFFSDAYRALQKNIRDMSAAFSRTHSDQVATSFERSARILGETRHFWARFADLPPIQVDTVNIIRDWQMARDLLAGLLAQKRSSPLDKVPIPDSVGSAVAAHEANLARLSAINQQLAQDNQAIAVVKQRSQGANPAVIRSALARLKSVQARHSPAISALCENYLAEKQAKVATEQLRDTARTQLDHYRVSVFPNYQTAINRYLTRFNAGFYIENVTATNTRGGPTCTYNLIINNTPVAVAGGNAQPGTHSFKNTLSAGDRNALALAFFFASIELDPNETTKTVVIDDPVSSLDEHRSLTTVQEIRRLSTRVSQVIVLSHSKPFLCRIWDGANPASLTALHVIRNGNASTIEAWNVDNDSITEHDRRSTALRDYRDNGTGNEREIAQSLRPHVEAFFRVAYPEHFPPGTLLGPFRRLCDQRLLSSQPILNTADTEELRNIIEYANRFHHDTNAAWETEHINAGELNGFVNRVLMFVKRT